MLAVVLKRRHDSISSLPFSLLISLFLRSFASSCTNQHSWSDWDNCCCNPLICGKPPHQYRWRESDIPTSSFRGQNTQQITATTTTIKHYNGTEQDMVYNGDDFSHFSASVSSSSSEKQQSLYCLSTYSVKLCSCNNKTISSSATNSVTVSYGTSLLKSLEILGVSNFTKMEDSSLLASHLYQGIEIHEHKSYEHYIQATTTIESHTILGTIIRGIASFMYSFGGIVPFYPQYQRIRKTRNDKGFSTTVCLILLIANILRIQFWMLKHFHFSLLLQSVSMTVAQLLLLDLCIHVRTGKITLEKSADRRTPSFWASPIGFFWAWSDFSDYLTFVILFSFVTSIVSYIFSFSSMYAEILGSMSVGVEAIILVPQCIQNYERQSTEGLSYAMMVMWTFGDFMKLTYFAASEVPIQFIVCAVIQCSIDIIVMLQISVYAERKNPKFVSLPRRLSSLMRSDVNLSRRKKTNGERGRGEGSRNSFSTTSTSIDSFDEEVSVTRSLLDAALGTKNKKNEDKSRVKDR
jgi:solute carrier family 66, member 2